MSFEWMNKRSPEIIQEEKISKFHYFIWISIFSHKYTSTLATSCEELTHWKRLWCWEGLGAGWEGDDRGWDGWIASPTRWTWVWVNSRSWWWTGRPGMLWFMGSQRVGHDWVTELNWTELIHQFTGDLKNYVTRAIENKSIMRLLLAQNSTEKGRETMHTKSGLLASGA